MTPLEQAVPCRCSNPPRSIHFLKDQSGDPCIIAVGTVVRHRAYEYRALPSDFDKVLHDERSAFLTAEVWVKCISVLLICGGPRCGVPLINRFDHEEPAESSR